MIYTSTKNRDEGFSIVVGNELTDWVKNAKLFMIGAGAIGCELLKNLAMVGLGTGK
jgi:ubiquitin-activating enzyme E1